MLGSIHWVSPWSFPWNYIYKFQRNPNEIPPSSPKYLNGETQSLATIVANNPMRVSQTQTSSKLDLETSWWTLPWNTMFELIHLTHMVILVVYRILVNSLLGEKNCVQWKYLSRIMSWTLLTNGLIFRASCSCNLQSIYCIKFLMEIEEFNCHQWGLLLEFNIVATFNLFIALDP